MSGNENLKFLTSDIKTLGKTRRAAAMVASIIESYYTCAETVFLRISRHFENSLAENRWHKALLEAMRIDIEDIDAFLDFLKKIEEE